MIFRADSNFCSISGASGIEPQFWAEFLQRGENFLSPEKPGAAGVDAPGLDKKKKMVFGLNHQLDLFGASHYYSCNQVDFGVIG